VFAELVLEDARRRALWCPAEAHQGTGPACCRRPGGPEDGWSPNPAIFRTLLEASGAPPAKRESSVSSWPRIDQYPANKRQRHELLQWIAGQAFTPGEELSEKDVNERLGRYASDHVTLRRYLVDAELLERTRAGSAYSPSSTAPADAETGPREGPAGFRRAPAARRT
jgi:hypothetical protein